MSRHDDRIAEFSDLRRFLSPDQAAAAPISLPEDGALLRMYPAHLQPRAGSLRSDLLDVDSHWHFHDMHQLIYAFEGALEIESETGRHLVPRQLAAWIPAGALHRVGLHQIRSGSVFFTTDMIPAPGDRIRTVLVAPLMREMMREAFRWPLQGPDSPLRTSFLATMAGLCAEWIEREADLFMPTCRDARLRRALEFTEGKLEAKLAEVCREAGLSERSFRRRLKLETGLTWEACRQRSRLLRAIALLGETDAPIIDIALSCGFESQSSFAKAFRTAMGETPTEYRFGATKG
ncbi:helix-turn-helix transcriptional regulator [Phenylobacterium sp. LjRoot219]|uniref:helix-turn-helix domain-containing protein n=1 Tax=Phenylobacterium sp. LjRoot219 TaxID=3342283 RepID=UPI003ECC9073